MGETEDAADGRQFPRRRMPTGFASLRDIITFFVGMAIIFNEVFLQKKVEATTLAIGAAMAGLPFAFNADERRRPPKSDEESK